MRAFICYSQSNLTGGQRMAIKTTTNQTFSEICKEMEKINKRKPSNEQIDELVDILNEIDDSEESTQDNNEQVAKNREENGIEQNWL